MAAADTARLIAEITLKDKISAGIAKVSKNVTGLEKKFGKMGGIAASGARTAGRNIERGITVGVVAGIGALGYAVKQAADQETAIAGIAKTVEGDIAGVVTELKTLAATVPVSFEELAGIAELGGAMGIARDDLAAFTRQVAILGTTTNVSVEDAATALGQMQNVIGLTGDEFDNFTASLVELGNKGNSTEAQILEIARRSGGAAKLIGVAKEATLGWAAAAANLGLNEELAGTALQNFFVKTQTVLASGGPKLVKLAQVAGVSTKEFKRAFEEDATGALTMFLRGLTELSKGERIKAIQKLYGKGSGMTRLLIGLSDSMDKNLVPSLETGTKAWIEATAAQEEANKKWATTDSQLKILRGNIDLAAATIGTELLPVLADLAKEGVTWLQDPKTQRGIKAFAKDLGAGARDVAKWLKSIDWDSIGSGLRTAAQFAKGLVDAFLSMPTEVKALIVGLAGLNKLTGGMVFDLGGAAFEQFLGKGSPANPMFVVPIGPGLGGPPVPGGGKLGFGKLLLGFTGVGLAALLASEFEDEIQGLAEDLSKGWRGVVEDIFDVKIPTITTTDLEWPFGPKNTPTILPEIFGGNGLLGGTGAGPRTIDIRDGPSGSSASPFFVNPATGFKTLVTSAPNPQTGFTTPVKTGGGRGGEWKPVVAEVKTVKTGVDGMKTSLNTTLGFLNTTTQNVAAETRSVGTIIAANSAQERSQAAFHAATQAAQNASQILGIAGTRFAIAGLTNVVSSTSAQQRAQLAMNAVSEAANAARQVLATTGAGIRTAAAQSRTTSAVHVRGAQETAAIYAIGNKIASTIWAARPVIQSNTIIQKYNVSERGGTSSGSRTRGGR